MNLTSPIAIKEILEKYQIKPKSLGQNFLIDKNILDKIILAGNLSKQDVVLEVGPGLGALTQELAKSAGKVIAIEKDHDMINILSETLKEFENIEIIEGDALEILISSSLRGSSQADEAIQNECTDSRLPRSSPAEQANFTRNDKTDIFQNYKVVANIPYYLTSHLIRTFLECKNPPEEIILLIQKEVALRICAKPPEMSLLAVSVQFYAKVKIISYVSKNCFLPAPKVDSAIIKITPHIIEGDKELNNFSGEEFFKIVKAGFSHPRKQLANNFITSLKLNRKQVEEWLLKNNIKPNQRAETLSIKDWRNLVESFPQFDS